jgi:signal peptidase I
VTLNTPVMAENEAVQASPRAAFSRWGRWLRIAAIGRNPKFTAVRIAVLVLAFIIISKFIFLPIRVDGISMFPTYKDRSVNFINRLAFVGHQPHRGDVVGIRLTGTNVFYRTPGVMYMKRIIGLPGETVSFFGGSAFINGVKLDEPYLRLPCKWSTPPIVVGPDQYFVVGDNRTMPPEYHYHGRISKAQVVGKVLF